MSNFISDLLEGNKEVDPLTVTWLLRDNTVYRRNFFYGNDNKEWLDAQSELFKQNKYLAYIPVGSVETQQNKNVFVGYLWNYQNMSNHLLTSMNDWQRNIYYPNLTWCDIGNHPYPKGIRVRACWQHQQFNKLATRLVYPDVDIMKSVILPSQIEGCNTP